MQNGALTFEINNHAYTHITWNLSNFPCLLSFCILPDRHQYLAEQRAKMSGESDFYLCLFFDVNRGGFFDVAEKILSYLDYKSFVQFKQSCKMVYDFIKTSNIEQVQSYLAVKVY